MHNRSVRRFSPLFRVFIALGLIISVLVGVPASPAGAVGETSDDFNSTTPDPAWSEVGLAGTDFSYNGAQAAILAPAGSASFDPWVTGNNAPTLVQTISDGDLDVVAAFATETTEKYQIQGIIVGNAADTEFLRFDVFFDGTDVHAFAAEPMVSTTPLINELTPTSAHSRFVRVVYDDSTGDWTLYTSPANESNPALWTDHGTFNRPMNVGRIGPFGGTSFPDVGQPAPGHVAFVDYFGEFPVPGSAIGSSNDTTDPTNSALVIEKTTTTMKVMWTTDEPTMSTLSVDGGSATQSTTDTATYGLNHEVELSGLTANTSYSLRVVSTDVNGNTDDDTSVQSTPATDNAPIITFWYGDEQSVGGTGQAQRWFNLQGRATDTDGIASMTYSVNGGPDQFLDVGADTRRLARTGDFNADVLVSSLNVGENTIAVTARDTNGQESTKTATITRISGVTAPPALGIDWSEIGSLGDVATPVDGNWTIDSAGLRVVDDAYDRILAIGGQNWTNYDVLVPITIHTLNANFEDSPSFGAGVGVFLRWNGHNDTVLPGSQPQVGFWPDGVNPTPLGSIAWWEDPVGIPERLSILDVTDTDGIGSGSDPSVKVGGTAVFTQTFDTTYMLRAQVEGNVTRLKVWNPAGAEPGGWSVTYNSTGLDPNEPSSGSLAFVAHEAVATFGDVIVTPLSPSGTPDPTSAPTLDPPSGSTVGQSTNVTASAASGAVIHYTTDGSTPTPLSPVYTSGVPVAATMKFIAYQADKDPSSVVTATYAVNSAPVVSAGPDTTAEIGEPLTLAGSVTDDGATGSVTISWTKVEGPGTATFSDSSSPTSTVTFTQPGSYRLLLTADDGQEVRTDEVTISVAGGGYWLANGSGRVKEFGSVNHLGDLSGSSLAAPVSGIAANPARTGYWLTQQNGAITPFGAVPDIGGLDDLNIVPVSPIVDMAATSTGLGAYLLGEDGGIFAFGDAEFYGSTGDIDLDLPVVSMANHATGRGYWFVARDGGIFTFGPDARFLGSVPEVVPYSQLAADIVGMAVTPSGNGYWLVAADGGIFAFGDAPFINSIPGVLGPGQSLAQPIVGMVATPSGKGYWLVAADGGVFAFGDAAFHGSDPTLGTVVGLA